MSACRRSADFIGFSAPGVACVRNGMAGATDIGGIPEAPREVHFGCDGAATSG
jgi:hypothetical protein